MRIPRFLPTGALAVMLLASARSLAAQTPAPATYKIQLSSGPFGLPVDAQSVDWVVFNASPDTQFVQVTAWRLNPDGPKGKLEPGTLSLRLPPGGMARHSTSMTSMASFYPGYFYEVTVGLNDRRVLPMIQLSSDRQGRALPGTRIGPTDFIELRP